jgi:hypothetical protein
LAYTVVSPPIYLRFFSGLRTRIDKSNAMGGIRIHTAGAACIRRPVAQKL